MSELDQFENLRMELRRGAIVLAVLSQFVHEHYGYSLRKALVQKGLDIDEGTLYPLIRRLEKQGLLVSEWREEAKRRKRFYIMSDSGRAVYQQLKMEWQKISTSVNSMIEENENEPN